MGKKRRRQQNDDQSNQLENKRQHVEELPKGVHHYEYMNDVPSEIQQ